MPNLMEKAIKDSFLRLLDEYPLSEITVKSIVMDCGINRNSFYYHYQGIPELLEEIAKEESDLVIRKYAGASTLQECFDAVVEFASAKKRAIMHIYRSVSRDVFERYLRETADYFVRRYAAAAFKDQSVNPQDQELLIICYRCLLFGLVTEWLNQGMKEESIREFRRIFEIQSGNMTDPFRLIPDQQ